MNFIEKCIYILHKTSELHDLGDDIKNYNEWFTHRQNFFNESMQTIINFILKVRFDNPVFTVTQQLTKAVLSDKSKPLRTLYELNIFELYNEFNSEFFNIVCKGVYDSIKLYNNLNSEESNVLIQRLIKCDENLFNDYQHA